ncbi:MAG TPA: VWA domain-containing protein [Humisphaera sp.]
MTKPTNPLVTLARRAVLAAALVPLFPAAPVHAAPAIAVGKTVPVRAETGNRAVAVTVRNAALVDRYGEAVPAEGNLFVVLSTQWENVLPVKITNENKSIPTGYKIPDLADHAYLVVDGKRVARLSAERAALPGHMKLKDFGLPALGDVAKGNLVFEVPKELAASAGSFELYYFDLTHGHFRVDLAGDAPAARAALKPEAGPTANPVLEAAVYGHKRVAEYAGRKAPAGMEFVLVDLRAESRFGADADATAFDPKARPGSKVRKAIFADWTDWRKYAHLVLDAEHAYAPEPGGELPDVPRFLPEVKTGGTVAYLVPQGAKLTELRLDFPNAKAGAQVIRPGSITLRLEGTYGAPPKREQLAMIDDDIFKVYVVGQAVATEFAGAKPATGKFLVLDVLVENTRRDGEFFQVKEQLKLATEAGAQAAVAEATFAGPWRPTPVLFVPGDGRRSFQVAFELPKKLARPRLAYAGVSLAKTVDLRPLDGAAADPSGVAGATTTRPGTPVAGTPGATTRPVAVVPNVRPSAQKDKLPVRVAAKQPHKELGLAGVGLAPEQVNASIDRGAKWLWAAKGPDMLKKDHSWDGHDGLYLLALVHAGHHKKDAECDRAVREYLAEADPLHMGVYATGVYLMLAESYGDAMYMPRVRLAAKFLVESQGKGGTWGYNGNRNEKLYARPEPDLSQPLSIVGGRPLEGPGSDAEPLVRVSKPEAGEDGDNSSTQYAVLGLHSAARMGVKVPPETWKRALDETSARQCEDGGWAYHQVSSSYGSMACAGVGTSMICRFHLGEKEPAASPAVERGFGWLDAKFSVTQNPEQNDRWHYYYLYGLERVGRIADTEWVGDHEWYPYGARFLVGKQEADGSWKNPGDDQEPPLPTSFALLFLTRATPSLTAVAKTGPGTIRTEMTAPKGHRVYIILDSTGTMNEATDGVPRAQTAREAMAKLVAELPDNTEVAVRAFGHRKSPLEEGADTDTELVVPLAKMDRAKVVQKINGLRPRGKTPLSLTFQQATDDLKGTASREHPVTVILVTDGGGDNTRPKVNPLVAVERLGSLPGVSLYVVGFDVKEPEYRQQLVDLSTRGRGRYLSVERSDALLKELRNAVFRTPEGFAVYDAAGKQVAGGAFGQSATLPPGKYTVATSLSGYTFRREAWVNANSTTVARFDPIKVDFSKPPEAVVVPTAVGVPAVPAVPNAGTPQAATTTRPATPAAATPKFCTNCGKPLTPGAKFCTSCGAKVPVPQALDPK